MDAHTPSSSSTSTSSPSSTTPTTGRVLARFGWDCGRMGRVEGLFITTVEALEAAYGKQVYFGEILGKHSEVYGTLDRGDITVLTDDADFLDKLTQFVGTEVGGYNPLSYLSEE